MIECITVSWLNRFSCFYLVIVVASLWHSSAASNESDTITVQFCVPQNDFYPFFITRNNRLTGINPELVRKIFNNDSLQGVTVEFDRRPWKRCNADLEKGKVDMMIGGFDENRINVVYPSDLGFVLTNSAISTADVCFSSIAGRQMDAVKRGLLEKAPFTVGIEPGFTKKHHDNIAPEWLVLFNPREKYRMLELGRVDAIVQVCQMDGKFAIETQSEAIGFSQFETVHPPYLSNPAYIVFSKDFAAHHNTLAQTIISLSTRLDKIAIYNRYKPTK
jgi:hypothetical protein